MVHLRRPRLLCVVIVALLISHRHVFLVDLYNSPRFFIFCLFVFCFFKPPRAHLQVGLFPLAVSAMTATRPWGIDHNWWLLWEAFMETDDKTWVPWVINWRAACSIWGIANVQMETDWYFNQKRVAGVEFLSGSAEKFVASSLWQVVFDLMKASRGPLVYFVCSKK